MRYCSNYCGGDTTKITLAHIDIMVVLEQPLHMSVHSDAAIEPAVWLSKAGAEAEAPLVRT